MTVIYGWNFIRSAVLATGLAAFGASVVMADEGLANRLESLIGQERAALDLVPTARLAALTTPPPPGTELAVTEATVTQTEVAATEVIPAVATASEAVAEVSAETVALAIAPVLPPPHQAAVAPESGVDLGALVGGAPPGSGAEWQCLTEALYFEARGESLRGVMAVAEVILNRVDSPSFPNTVCGVVHQGTQALYDCQFTYHCDGVSDAVHEQPAWNAVGRVASAMLSGAPRTLTNGATHYHTTAVNPSWSRRFTQTATIGVHLFYRQPTRTASN
jgi:hypothetical protein